MSPFFEHGDGAVISSTETLLPIVSCNFEATVAMREIQKQLSWKVLNSSAVLLSMQTKLEVSPRGVWCWFMISG